MKNQILSMLLSAVRVISSLPITPVRAAAIKARDEAVAWLNAQDKPNMIWTEHMAVNAPISRQHISIIW